VPAESLAFTYWQKKIVKDQKDSSRTAKIVAAVMYAHAKPI
jgi:hypothetical protein